MAPPKEESGANKIFNYFLTLSFSSSVSNLVILFNPSKSNYNFSGAGNTQQYQLFPRLDRGNVEPNMG